MAYLQPSLIRTMLISIKTTPKAFEYPSIQFLLTYNFPILDNHSKCHGCLLAFQFHIYEVLD